MSRFKKHLFFCVNERSLDNPKGSCSNGGAVDLLDYAKMYSYEIGLKGIVRINKAGCLDACAHGPAVVVYPDSTWYAPKTKQDVEEIIEEHVQNDRIVERLVIHFKGK